MNFWDSSAILPMVVQEASSAGLRKFFTSHPEAVAWWGTPAECASTLARLEREGGLDATAVTEALRRLQDIHEVWHEVQPVDMVRETAVRLLRTHPLRAADSRCRLTPKGPELQRALQVLRPIFDSGVPYRSASAALNLKRARSYREVVPCIWPGPRASWRRDE